MADTHVFPGGKLEQSDYSPKWRELYNSIVPSHSFDDLAQWMLPKRKIGMNQISAQESRLPIYSSLPKDGIPGEIALRICAIRETFEECGVLLARQGDEGVKDHISGSFSSLSRPGSVQPSLISIPEQEKWRHRVHNNADDFIVMCRELQCVPDVWSLVEWSNWLTPENFPTRFDTVFYVCCTDQQPSAAPEHQEIVSTEWLSPRGAVEAMRKGRLVLPPPQLKEVSFMNIFPDLPCLQAYALHRVDSEHIYRRVSMRMKHGNRLLMVLNRDDLYPQDQHRGKEVGTVAQCQGDQLRDCVTLVRSDQQRYEYQISEDIPYETIDKKSVNKARLIIHKPSPDGFEFVETFEMPDAVKFIQNYLAEQKANSHSKL